MRGEKSFLRVKNTRVRDVKSRYVELLKHDLGHAFTVGGGVPGRFGDKYRMFGRVAKHNFLESVLDEGRYWREVLNCSVTALSDQYNKG